MSRTKIEWCDDTWNPIVGCSRISEGCRNCYAEKMAYRLDCMGAESYGKVIDEHTHCWTGKVVLANKALNIPLHWKKPRRIFVCSMGDLFHESVPYDWQNRVHNIIESCPQHIFQILTKRPKIMVDFYMRYGVGCWPKHLWVGISCENNWLAIDRILDSLQYLLEANRFVSCEPLLDAIDIWRFTKYINWLIVGCESGPNRRECKIKWVRDIVKQCQDANVPVFVKQLSINGKVSKNIDEWPEDLRVREFPKESEAKE